MAFKSQKVWDGAPSIIGASESSRMAWLTLSIIGLQFTWGLETTYCTPYLLQLGLTKSKTSIVWIAGPISGMIVAPLVGALADRSRSRWGRRRPFMIGGTIVVCICLILLGWAKEIVSAFLGPQAADGTPTVVLAIASLFALDCAINTVQWSSRSLIVDTLPASKQQTGSAWASRMVAAGHLFGYGIGALDMGFIFGYSVQRTQFKSMVVIAALALVVTVGGSSWAVTERILVSETSDTYAGKGPIAIARDILHTALHMPARMKAICRAQFWAWIGWFPFLFYGSEWIGEIALYEIQKTQQTLPQDRLALIGMKGSRALVLFSITAFIGSITFPLAVRSPEDESSENSATFTPRPPPGLVTVLKHLRLHALLPLRKPSLVTAWFIAHILFASTMVFAPFVTGVGLAEALIAVCGFSWSLATWAPHAFMGFEISKLGPNYVGNIRFAEEEGTAIAPGIRPAVTPSLGQAKRSRSSDELLMVERNREDTDIGDNDGRSGVYLGILNLFITLPQFIGAFISGTVFWMFDKPETDSGKGYLSIAICLFVGALAALAAAHATTVLRKTH